VFYDAYDVFVIQIDVIMLFLGWYVASIVVSFVLIGLATMWAIKHFERTPKMKYESITVEGEQDHIEVTVETQLGK